MHSSSPKVPTSPHFDRIDFRAIYYLLREKAWLICLCFLLAAFGTAAHLMRAPKVYAAHVVLQVAPDFELEVSPTLGDTFATQLPQQIVGVTQPTGGRRVRRIAMLLQIRFTHGEG